MPEQRRRTREVLDLAEHLTPVGEVEDAPRVIASHLRVLLGAAPENRPHPNHDQHREQRRQQPTPATHPELPEADATQSVAVAFLDQQRGDQEPGDDEEHLDSKESAVHPREACVVQDDSNHRHCAHAVERRLIAHQRGALDRPAGAAIGARHTRQRWLFSDVGHEEQVSQGIRPRRPSPSSLAALGEHPTSTTGRAGRRFDRLRTRIADSPSPPPDGRRAQSR